MQIKSVKRSQVTDIEELPNFGHRRKRNIVKTSICKLATDKYHASGFGIQYGDVMEAFLVGKNQAQRTLKYFHNKGVLFTARDLFAQGIDLLDSKNPQQYFPTCIKAEILEGLKKRKPRVSVLKTTIPSQKFALANALEYQKAQAFLDVLLLVPHIPLYIHKLQLLVTISKDDYKELIQLQYNESKRKRSHEEIIGRRYVKYLFSMNGTIEIFVTSNHSPFKIETDEDESLLFSFLGQVRDRLLYHVGDVRELYIPSLMDWILVQCDLNKDIEIDDKAQITLPDIQLRHLDRVFREYVKIVNGKAFCRAEESLILK